MPYDYSILVVRATYIWVLFLAYIPFVVHRAFNAAPTKRLQHSYPPMLVKYTPPYFGRKHHHVGIRFKNDKTFYSKQLAY